MIDSNTAALRIEVLLLARLQQAVKEIWPHGIGPLRAVGLLSLEFTKGEQPLARFGFQLLGEVDDCVQNKYLDGLLVNELAALFSPYFASQLIHFHLKATVRGEGVPENDFSTADVMHIPLLHALGQNELMELLVKIDSGQEDLV